MRTITIILLILGTLLLSGSASPAQSNAIREDDRAWIDSLAVQYRSNYMKANLAVDSAALVALYMELAVMLSNCDLEYQADRSEIDEAVAFYARQQQAFIFKKKLYEVEKRAHELISAPCYSGQREGVRHTRRASRYFRR